MNPTPQVSSLPVDVDDPNFYNICDDIVNDYKANVKKSIKIKRDLRIEAAEIELERAALYLNMHWSEFEEFKQLLETKEEFNVMLNNVLVSLDKRLNDMNFVKPN